MKKAKILSIILSIVIVFSLIPQTVSARDLSLQTAYASFLKHIHLFQGVNDWDFALERPATRVEAVVMIIRLLGQETAALSQDWWHPFTDVPEWADRYVGYAYQHGISNGISQTEFGTGTVSAPMFITYALRVLGYSDSNGDFSWSNPYALAEQVGLFHWNATVDLDNFLRADIVTVCMGVLGAERVSDGEAILNVLIDQGVYTEEEFFNGLDWYVGAYYDTLNSGSDSYEDTRLSDYDDNQTIWTVDDSDDPIVWITPTGKRWHADPDCGGVNSFSVRLSDAERRGLTPCQKCAY